MDNLKPFDKLARKYDSYRPRYPQALVSHVIDNTERNLRIIDAGSGTGIVLEWLLPSLKNPRVYAIDISAGMISEGSKKFPQATWITGNVEDILQNLEPVDLIVAGQAYQWFNRKQFLQIASTRLNKNGKIAIIQNNRDFQNNSMLSDYESLLEANSPGYTRNYRDINIKQEMLDWVTIPNLSVKEYNYSWNHEVPIEDFVGMSSSSTQVQRAVDVHGEQFLDDVRKLAKNYSLDGKVTLTYTTQLFVAE